MRILKLLFCKFFQFSKFIGNQDDDDPYAFKAMAILTLFLSLNLFTIIGYYKALIEHAQHIFAPTFYEVLIILLIGVLNYVLLLKENKYERIYKEFNKNLTFSGKAGTWIAIFYMIGSIAVMAGLIWVERINLTN